MSDAWNIGFSPCASISNVPLPFSRFFIGYYSISGDWIQRIAQRKFSGRLSRLFSGLFWSFALNAAENPDLTREGAPIHDARRLGDILRTTITVLDFTRFQDFLDANNRDLGLYDRILNTQACQKLYKKYISIAPLYFTLGICVICLKSDMGVIGRSWAAEQVSDIWVIRLVWVECVLQANMDSDLIGLKCSLFSVTIH